VIRRLNRAVDERLGSSKFTRETLNKIFPDHWSFMLGEIALYAFITLVLTGIYLSFFFSPSKSEVVYRGVYAPLNGMTVSEAYRSVIRISFDTRSGLVMRQTHHWAALVFVAAIVAHLCRIFFTGAFRKPREINWLVGVTLLLLALANGFTGYSLADDLLSGTGLRVTYSFMLSVPIVGEWLAFLVFGGEYPAHDILQRFFVIHILLVPLAIIGLVSAHLAILWRQKHSQFRGRGRRERNVVGSKLWPTYTAKSVGLFAMVLGVLTALGGLVQINPVWLYGPYEPAAVSTAAQPDWYLGWTEGAIRIFPAWFFEIAGHPVPPVFWPVIVLPGITFLLLYAWPFLEARVTGDHAEHHLLDRPSDRPVRTAIGAGVLTFYGVLTFAGSQDVIAQKLGLSIPPVTYTFRGLTVGLPIVVALVVWKFAGDLRRSGHVAEEEESAEPPVGPYQAEVEGEAAGDGGTAPVPPPRPTPGPSAWRAVVAAAGLTAALSASVVLRTWWRRLLRRSPAAGDRPTRATRSPRRGAMEKDRVYRL